MTGLFIKNGKWYFHCSISGKLVRKSTGLKSTRENKPIALQIRKDYIRQHDLSSVSHLLTPLMISESVKRFLLSLRVKPYTLDGYRRKLQYFVNFLGADYPADKVTAQHFFDFLNTRGKVVEDVRIPVTQNTQANYSRHLRLLFNWMIKNRMIAENPIPRLRSVQTSVRTIPPADKDAIFSYLLQLNINYWRFCKIMDFTGMRPGEVQALTWQQFDFHNKVLNIWNSKESRNDQFPIYPNFSKFLNSWKQESGLVFPTMQGRFVIQFFKRAAKHLKMNYSIYDLRKTFGSDMASRMTEIELATLMRHRNIETTRRYYVSLNLHKTAKKISR